ncbi:thioredoxin [Neolewinella aurantiaca]|uniref:Thioredoxin n=1 Tax=Neolewinella aurantiaca TaxID=2602767 RepID=A0A5C7FTK9_9BACT|nr:thioredoxin domain-containing protein [Neolewinella aurantiaca]TXF89580.1 thioredoxin [Neolewinella aurantiaca]
MLLRKLSLLAFLFTLSLSSFAQGIEFFHGTWEEALVKAETEGKLIFVDAYTTWCGPCKRMSANVFPVAEVGDVFNANFINVKLDMEKAESVSFRKVHPVRAYPTLFWINGKDEAVHTSVGGKQVNTLIAAAKEAISKQDDIEALAAEWEAGDRSSKLAFTYIRALVRRGESHLKVANDYLRDQKDLTTPDNLNIIQVATTNADSRIFDLLMKNKAALVALNGQDEFDATVKRAVNATKARSLEFKDASLLETAVKKLSAVDPAAGKQLKLEGEFELAAKGTDEKDFLKAMKNYLKKGVNGDAVRLQDVYQVAANSKFIGSDKVLDMAIEAAAASAAAEQDGGFEKYYRLAAFLLSQDRTEQALTYARMAKDLMPEGKANYGRAVDSLIQKIQNSK